MRVLEVVEDEPLATLYGADDFDSVPSCRGCQLEQLLVPGLSNDSIRS